MKKQKLWCFKPTNEVLQHILARELGVSKIIAQLLVNRGIYTVTDARNFLDVSLDDLHDPFLMRDMDHAVERAKAAVESKEKILVYGDYDVDGFTSTALVLSALRSLGADADYYIPNRLDDGYGLHLDTLSRLHNEGVDLVITVDCGIASVEEAAWAKDNKLDLIITDHHEPGEQLPDALAVLDPKRCDCPYPFQELAGVGVALKFVQALFSVAGKDESRWQDYLDLVCLGTVADIVPLRDENRVLVKYGLGHLAKSNRPGVQALIAVSRIDKENITPRDVSFILAPRLNAAGRTGDPRLGVDLLLCDNPEQAGEMAEALQRENSERQRLERKAFAEALEILKNNPSLEDDKVIVLASEEWHPGVIGIVASKVSDRFYRPVLLVALDGGEGRGSARSIHGFNMYEALEHCRETLVSYGGHAQAAGFTIERDKIEELRININGYANKEFEETPMTPSLELDCLVSLEDVSESLIEEIEQLSPYGHGNPVPVLGSKGVSVLACREVGKTGAHLKMVVQENKAIVDGIGFNLAGESDSDPVYRGRRVDLAFTPGMNEWNGKRSVQLEVVDLQNSSIPVLEMACGGNGSNTGDMGCPCGLTAEGLAKAGHLLFIPDYINGRINRHYENGKRNVPSLKNSNENPGKIGGGRILDYRHKSPDTSWLTEHKKNILLVPTPYQTVETAFYLRKTVGEESSPIGFYHPLINETYRKDILAEFDSGRINTLVCTYDSVGEIEFDNLPTVVAYRLPFSTAEIRNVLAIWNKGLSFDFCLMYDSTDISFNRHKLKAFAPGREWLGAFYLLLKKHSDKKNGKFSFKTRFMIKALRMMKFSHVEAYTIKIALTILSELNLLGYWEIEEGWHIQLRCHPSRKLNLEDAGTYIWARGLQKRLLAEQGKLLQAPVEELFA